MRTVEPVARPGRVVTFARRWWPPVVLVVAVVVGWELWVIAFHSPAYVLPSPWRVAGAFRDSWAILPGHVLATAGAALAGLGVGAVAGVAIAVIVASSALARRFLEPLLVVSQTIPMIVLAPLLVLWFGIGLMPKVVVVALITFFPVTVSTTAGLLGTDAALVDLVRSMGASRRQVMRTVRLPAAVPSFFAGLRIAAAYAVAGAVIGELVAGERGLGVFINRSRSSFRVDRVFVAVVVVAVLSALLFAAVGRLERIAVPWRPRPQPLREDPL